MATTEYDKLIYNLYKTTFDKIPDVKGDRESVELDSVHFDESYRRINKLWNIKRSTDFLEYESNAIDSIMEKNKLLVAIEIILLIECVTLPFIVIFVPWAYNIGIKISFTLWAIILCLIDISIIILTIFVHKQKENNDTRIQKLLELLLAYDSAISIDNRESRDEALKNIVANYGSKSRKQDI